MEVVFLIILVLVMVVALTSGFPVAFALPGSAIFTIALAALCGYLFAGDSSAYFAQDGPSQWLSAGVTNFRSLYWIVERDTLIAIPLFVFMGIMLQRSRIAEDLLVAMAQLFGPVPGGLGISVVFVGALLAATTGIVGATVIAMGLISLPAMMRNNYSKSLATGTICASGTLGQIIPPSIVLIILADQLASAADQASTARKAEYKAATGEFSMPASFDVVSASAGDMFMGALIPGLILVGIYMLYILVSAIINPKSAPPVPYDGKYNATFFKQVLLALVPPLTLIFVVLGSIVSGVATVNQAGAIGAVGALIMAGYRLQTGSRGAYLPAILAFISLIVIFTCSALFNLNIKNIQNDSDKLGISIALIAVLGLLIAVGWSAVRAWRQNNTLHSVMVDTAKTTTMVFIILVGAAMLTSAFRGFGGEELVKHFLTGLPGGFWTQFLVVMLVIFLLGFFLDFIEIAVVVVPIVAPILLADPQANITAVWLGVMVGLNIQTSFLTPPFGFALFYLRGVAPKSIKTTDIYKGAVAFIVLQLIGLAVAGYFPPLVNYLPNRIFLTSENAPPPINPKLQSCLEDMLFDDYASNQQRITESISRLQSQDFSMLPETQQTALHTSLNQAADTFNLVDMINDKQQQREVLVDEYRPHHQLVRYLRNQTTKLNKKLDEHKDDLDRLSRQSNPDTAAVAAVNAKIIDIETRIGELDQQKPANWEVMHAAYQQANNAENKARLTYRRNVDESYETFIDIKAIINSGDELATMQTVIAELAKDIKTASDEGRDRIKSVEKQLSDIAGASKIKSQLSKARRALKGDTPKYAKAEKHWLQAQELLNGEVQWRQNAATALGDELTAYDESIRHNIGLRQQARLLPDQAKEIAACQSRHVDVSLNF